uniref:Uncharacterized protein n=1 Tax=Candidatus Kentrum sp. FW TaxID=2126338 RepID=A0A450T4F2_9GAMM|nr:MAG: hypothetical protein BECKFW1821A_GA0114235_11148 [Candidatus Kentron sp. FW]VFJ70460.1 MAG: hypothetical protein BECKFW1821B_GA0114236_11886 [Candidatus Kentron sp. FW]
MPYSNIDATLSLADVKVIKAAIDTILAKMPFPVNLTRPTSGARCSAS